MLSIGFRQMLARRQKAINSLVCVGLDPLPDKLPSHFNNKHLSLANKVAEWMIAIVEATVPYASMFKPQSAHWEAIPGGIEALQKVVRHIHNYYPGIPVFLDCKRGDIARTQACYSIAHFNFGEVDGMNFSPYMGKDCMEALVDKKHLGRALVGLCYTSNPAARQVQDVRLADGRLYWEFMAETILNWAEELEVAQNAGLVMAAAYENPRGSAIIYSEHLARCRQIVGDKLWFLIPGIGAQGGFVVETVRVGFIDYGSIAVNSSSGIIFASSGKDFAEAAAAKAKQLRDITYTAVAFTKAVWERKVYH